MSSLCYFLAVNLDMQARARAKARIAMNNDPSMTELREMQFVQACIRESLHVSTPITYVVPRTATKAVQPQSLDNTVLYIPRGSSIITDITTIHYRNDYWQNVNQFDPDRFMGLSEGVQAKYDATQWLPFAPGPRQCPNTGFGGSDRGIFQELCNVRATYSRPILLNEWEWTLPKDSPHRDGLKNRFSSFALSLPKDLYLGFKCCEKH